MPIFHVFPCLMPFAAVSSIINAALPFFAICIKYACYEYLYLLIICSFSNIFMQYLHRIVKYCHPKFAHNIFKIYASYEYLHLLSSCQIFSYDICIIYACYEYIYLLAKCFKYCQSIFAWNMFSNTFRYS